jgi:hypothetical protein
MSSPTVPAGGETDAFLSPFALRPRLENSVLPKIWTLSGLSDRDEGMLLALDRPEDLRDKLRLSEAGTDSRERKEDVAEENVFVLELLPKIELLFICSV